MLSTAALFGLGFFFLGSGCQRSTKPFLTNRDIIMGFIRASPNFFSNYLLDTTSFSINGTNISFKRSFRIGVPRDTLVVINSLDTVGNVIQSRAAIEAGVELFDTLVGKLIITDPSGTRNRPFNLLVSKFGYFLNLGNLAPKSAGWVLHGVSQTFIGAGGLLDSVRLRAIQSNKDTLFLRRPRSNDPENDPQLVKVFFNPFQLKPGDSLEVRVWGPDTSDFVFCHFSTFDSTRRLQLLHDSTGTFLGGFVLSADPRLAYSYRRLAIDAFSNLTFTDPTATVRNEVWGILYQIFP